MASIDFGILDSEGLESLAKANNVKWAGLSRVQLVGALRGKLQPLDDQIDTHRVTKQAGGCECTSTDATALTKMMVDLMETVRNLVAEVSNLRKISLEKEKGKDAAIAELREELRALTQHHQPIDVSNRALDSLQDEYSYRAATNIPATGVPVPASAPTGLESAAPGETYASRTLSAPRTSNASRTTDKPVSTKYDWSIVREAANRHRKPADLRGGKKIARRVVFVGGININCSADDLVAYCRKKNVEVTGCRLIPSRTVYGTLYAHLTVAEHDEINVLKNEFWPEHVTAREWKFKNPPLPKKS